LAPLGFLKGATRPVSIRADVVQHYNGFLHLGLTAQQQSDLVEYLKTH
jgi:hypothetical protein